MKTLICDWAVKTVIPFFKLFSFFILITLSSQTLAQGWTFIPQLQTTGCINAGAAQTIITQTNAQMSSLFSGGLFPTQSMCESLRQQILAIRTSFSQYDSRGRYIGECSIYYTCTPCTGSDIIAQNQANQVNPGEVTFDGQFQGKPFFTSHQSSAFSDWAKNYQQTLESYGITSILGKKLSAYQIPLTGDKNFNEAYLKASSNFNPKVTTPINDDTSVVDLRDIKEGGVVQLLTTPEQQKKRDEWYDNNIQDQGYNQFTNMGSDKVIKDYSAQDIGVASVRTAIMSAPGVEGIAGSFMLGVSDGVFEGLNGILPDLGRGNYQAAYEKVENLPGNVVRNSIAGVAADYVTDKGVAPILKTVAKATPVYKVIKGGITFYENLTGE